MNEALVREPQMLGVHVGFVSIYGILICLLWKTMRSMLRWQSGLQEQPSMGWLTLYASVLLGVVFGVLEMVAMFAATFSTMIITWITILILFTFTWKLIRHGQGRSPTWRWEALTNNNTTNSSKTIQRMGETGMRVGHWSYFWGSFFLQCGRGNGVQRICSYTRLRAMIVPSTFGHTDVKRVEDCGMIIYELEGDIGQNNHVL